MKETRFIAQNKEKWRESEILLESDTKDPEKLSNLFTQVIDDLSYSRTYYPNRSVRVYLNKIALQYFSIIYSHRPSRKNAFKHFWIDELPQIVIHCKKELITALLFFLVAMGIGVFSSINDPDFASTILGDQYIEMTNENIAKGDPMAVYKKAQEMEMFLGITINNLRVAFTTYVLGAFLGVGTLAMLLYNGIMVGCFQYFFLERGLFIESALTIWLHGTLEISSIILAGGAGLTLGRGLIFPGTYSRLQSFQISAIRSLKLMLGIAPVFVLAAIIESFLTRYTDAPVFLKLTIILLSATFIIGYFIIYPWLRARNGFDQPLKDLRLPASLTEPVNYTKVKNNAEVLKDTFHFFTRMANRFLPWVLVVSLIQAAVTFYLREDNRQYILSGWWEQIIGNMFYAIETETLSFIFINALSTAFILYRVMAIVNNEARHLPFAMVPKAFLQLSFITILIYSLIYLGAWGIFGLLCLFGFLFLMAFTQLTEKSGLALGVLNGWRLAIDNFRQMIEFKVILLLLAFSFLLVLSAPLVLMYSEILKWNLGSETWVETVIGSVETFIKIFSFNLLLPVFAAGTGILYFSLEEINSATSLKNAIARVGTRSQKNQKR